MILNPLLLAYLVSLFFLPKEKKKLVVGQITYSAQYCQGAKPTEELLKELRTPKAFAGKKFFIRKGALNNLKAPIIASVVTDSSGKFKVSLNNGIYCVVSENKKDKSIYNQYIMEHSKKTKDYAAVDMQCLNNWIKTPDFSFEVKKASVTMDHNYVSPCPWETLPCIQFTGPLPP